MAGGRNTFTMRVDTAGLQSLMSELGNEAEQAARPAAQAAAQVLYQAARANAQRIDRVTGRLAASIYQAYSPGNSKPGVATYHVSWRTSKGDGPKGAATGLARAPHGHLIEFGHWRYYQTGRDASGKFHQLVRPEMQGKPKPRGDRRNNRAALDAYYVPLPQPVWVPAQPFLRPAAAKADEAVQAAQRELLDRIDAAMAKAAR